MTLVNAEFYIALRHTRCPQDKATAAAAAVLNRPFTKADAACVRDALEAAGAPPEKAEAAANSLLQHLR